MLFKLNLNKVLYEKIIKKMEETNVELLRCNFIKEDEEGNIQLQIVGETVIYDKMTSQYRIILKDKKEAFSITERASFVIILLNLFELIHKAIQLIFLQYLAKGLH